VRLLQCKSCCCWPLLPSAAMAVGRVSIFQENTCQDGCLANLNGYENIQLTMGPEVFEELVDDLQVG